MSNTDKYEGHHICRECTHVEKPINTIDSGEKGLTHYYFICYKCDFYWYVALRTDENKDGASIGVRYVGYMDEDGSILGE
jgi:hypothetical protein